MGAITFLIGGARSGKSALAVEIGRRHDGAPHRGAPNHGSVVFIATAEPFDDDLRTRIDRHRRDRPGWPTLEAPLDPAAALANADPSALVIIDCLTVWVGNLMHDGATPDQVVERAQRLVAELAERDGPSVVVSNETGMGVHPPTELGRCYRDLLGTVNKVIAAEAKCSLLVVAGRALVLTDPWDALR